MRNRALVAALVISAATLSGCSNIDQPSAGVGGAQDVKARANALAAHPRPKYLPPGVGMPDTGRYTMIPKPFVVGDLETIPSNLPNVVDLLRGHGLPIPQSSGFNDSWRGWLLTTGRGIYAAFDVAEDPIIAGGYVPNGWTFYAPTALAHGKACLEITNFHSALPPGAAIGVYDFCNAHDWVQTIALNDPATRNCCVRSYTDPWDGTLRQRYFV